MFGIRGLTSDDFEAEAGPASPTKTTFGIHVLDDDFRSAPSPSAPSAPDESALGSTSLGVQAPRVGGGGRVPGAPGTALDAHTMVGLRAYRDDDSQPVKPTSLESDWLGEIGEFIEQKIADGTIDVPPDQPRPPGRPFEALEPSPAPAPAQRETSVSDENVAGFGIMRRSRPKRAGEVARSAPVATAGSTDRQALAAQSSGHRVDRVEGLRGAQIGDSTSQPLRLGHAADAPPYAAPAPGHDTGAAEPFGQTAILPAAQATLAGLPASPGGRKDSLDYLIDVAPKTRAMSALGAEAPQGGARLPNPIVNTPAEGLPFAGEASATLAFSPDLSRLREFEPGSAGRGITPPEGYSHVDPLSFDARPAHAFVDQAAAAAKPKAASIEAAMGPAQPPEDPRFLGAVPQRTPSRPPDLISVARERKLGGEQPGRHKRPAKGGGTSSGSKLLIALVAVAVIIAVASVVIAVRAGSAGSGEEGAPPPTEAPSGQ